MKALYKSSSTSHVLRLVERPVPDVTDTADVLIEVACTGICRTDLYVATGEMASAPELILGHEFCGTIVSVGGRVERADLAPGHRVTAHPLLPCGVCTQCTRSKPCAAQQMLGVWHDGSFAQYVRVPAHLVYPLPDSLTDRQGAYIEPVAASLATLNAELDPTSRGMLFGSGRIAQLTLRVMRAAGFDDLTLIAPEDLHTLPDRELFDYAVETRATDGALVHLVRALTPGGTLVLKSRPASPVQFDVHEAVRRALRIRAVDYAPYEDAIALLASGRLDVADLLGPIHPMSDYEAVFAELLQHETHKHFFDPSR